MNSPLVLYTRSTGAEVAGEQKTFSKSACNSLNAGFCLTTAYSLVVYAILDDFRGLGTAEGEDKDKDLSLKDEDKDKDLKIGPRGYSRTTRGQGLSSRTTTLQIEIANTSLERSALLLFIRN